MQVRQRSCMCPAASAGGQDCDGENFQVRECEGVPPCHPDFNIRTIDKGGTHLSSASAGSRDGSKVNGDQEEVEKTDKVTNATPKVPVN